MIISKIIISEYQNIDKCVCVTDKHDCLQVFHQQLAAAITLPCHWLLAGVCAACCHTILGQKGWAHKKHNNRNITRLCLPCGIWIVDRESQALC